jgi:hypothetical protein
MAPRERTSPLRLVISAKCQQRTLEVNESILTSAPGLHVGPQKVGANRKGYFSIARIFA